MTIIFSSKRHCEKDCYFATISYTGFCVSRNSVRHAHILSACTQQPLLEEKKEAVSQLYYFKLASALKLFLPRLFHFRICTTNLCTALIQEDVK